MCLSLALINQINHLPRYAWIFVCWVFVFLCYRREVINRCRFSEICSLLESSAISPLYSFAPYENPVSLLAVANIHEHLEQRRYPPQVLLNYRNTTAQTSLSSESASETSSLIGLIDRVSSSSESISRNGRYSSTSLESNSSGASGLLSSIYQIPWENHHNDDENHRNNKSGWCTKKDVGCCSGGSTASLQRDMPYINELQQSHVASLKKGFNSMDSYASSKSYSFSSQGHRSFTTPRLADTLGMLSYRSFDSKGCYDNNSNDDDHADSLSASLHQQQSLQCLQQQF